MGCLRTAGETRESGIHSPAGLRAEWGQRWCPAWAPYGPWEGFGAGPLWLCKSAVGCCAAEVVWGSLVAVGILYLS